MPDSLANQNVTAGAGNFSSPSRPSKTYYRDTASIDNPHVHLYKSHGLHNSYDVVPGVYALPVAENPPTDPELLATWSPVEVVYAHAPHRVRTVNFSLEKEGAPPMVPAPEDTGAFVYLGGSIQFHGPQLNSGLRNYIWTTSGQYTFVEYTKSDLDDGFVLGSFPFSSTIQMDLASQYLTGAKPTTGAVAAAGLDAQLGWTEAREEINFESTGYKYVNPTYYPSHFFNSGVLNGNVPIPGVNTSQNSLA